MRFPRLLVALLMFLAAGRVAAQDAPNDPGDSVVTIGQLPAPPTPTPPIKEETPAASLTLDWPLPIAAINSLFGTRTDPVRGWQAQFHQGVDLEAHYGAVVRAAATGVVLHAGWHRGHGREVLIEHVGGYRTRYAHLSQIMVLPGTRVRAGQALGLVGNSGRSTGPHLHFEIHKDGVPVDPLALLGETLPLPATPEAAP